jgi:hypothetical protein
MPRRLNVFGCALALVLAIGLALPLAGEAKGAKGSGGPSHVKAYTKKDGTQVAAHERKAPHAATTVAPPPKPAPSAPTSATVARDQRGRIQRSDAARHAFARQTGFPNGRPGWVIDHIKPLACGGVDAPSNMQWQTVAEGKAKDGVERRGC